MAGQIGQAPLGDVAPPRLVLRHPGQFDAEQDNHRHMEDGRIDQPAGARISRQGADFHRAGRDATGHQQCADGPAAAQQAQHEREGGGKPGSGCPAGHLQFAALEQRFGGQRLQHRPCHYVIVGNGEDVAQLHRGRADDDQFVSDALCGNAPAQHVDEGNLVDPRRVDAEIDARIAAFEIGAARQYGGQSGNLAQGRRQGGDEARRQAIAVQCDIDRCRIGLFEEAGERERDIIGVADELLEGAQPGKAAGPLQRVGKELVVAGIAGAAEIYVKGHIRGAHVEQGVQRLGMQPAGPGPHSDLGDAGAIHRHHDHIAGGRPAGQRKAAVLQHAVEGIEGAKVAQDRKAADR